MFCKKVFLKISQNSQENTIVRAPVKQSCRPQACNFIKKETPMQVFSFKFREIFQNTFLQSTFSNGFYALFIVIQQG